MHADFDRTGPRSCRAHRAQNPHPGRTRRHAPSRRAARCETSITEPADEYLAAFSSNWPSAFSISAGSVRTSGRSGTTLTATRCLRQQARLVVERRTDDIARIDPLDARPNAVGLDARCIQKILDVLVQPARPRHAGRSPAAQAARCLRFRVTPPAPTRRRRSKTVACAARATPRRSSLRAKPRPLRASRPRVRSSPAGLSQPRQERTGRGRRYARSCRHENRRSAGRRRTRRRPAAASAVITAGTTPQRVAATITGIK